MLNWDYKETEADIFYSDKESFGEWFEQNENDLAESYIMTHEADLTDETDYKAFVNWVKEVYANK